MTKYLATVELTFILEYDPKNTGHYPAEVITASDSEGIVRQMANYDIDTNDIIELIETATDEPMNMTVIMI